MDYTASFYNHWNKQLVEKLIKEWEVEMNEKYGLLSEGQAQKVSIILSLGHEPELLIFDGPVASLDPSARRQFLKTILEVLSERECTIFCSTHITSKRQSIPKNFNLEGFIHCESSINEAIISVRKYKKEIKEKIEKDLSAAVEVENLNLEEIFLELNR